LSGSAANLVLAFAGTVTEHTGTIEATGTTTVAQANTLDAATTGVITATIQDEATTLATLTGTGNAYTITLDNDDAASLAELVTINAATTGSITLNALSIAENYSGSSADLVSAFAGTVTEHTGTVTIADAPTLAQLVTINAETTGAITLSTTNGALSGSAANLVLAFAGTVTTHTGTVTITDEPTASQLKTINDATTGAITLNDVDGALSGSAANLVDAFAGTVTEHEGTVAVTTAASTSQLTTIDAATTGVITVTTTTVGANIDYDLTTDLAADGSTDLANFTGLTTINASEAGNTAMTITAADIFAANDTTGDLTFNVTGTDGGSDTLDLSEGAESWSTADSVAHVAMLQQNTTGTVWGTLS
jgi:hypothetical protein